MYNWRISLYHCDMVLSTIKILISNRHLGAVQRFCNNNSLKIMNTITTHPEVVHFIDKKKLNYNE